MNKIKENEIVLYSDDTAAQIKTVTGWVSRDGRFWGNDEHMARYSGCTHRKCECGNVIERGYIKCGSCSNKENEVRYFKMPFKVWDGNSAVYCETCEHYFFNEDELVEYCEENNILLLDLRLVICEENYFNEVDYEYWNDILPDDSDGDLPKELEDALAALNSVIKTLPAASYAPGKYRTSISENQPVENNF